MDGGNKFNVGFDEGGSGNVVVGVVVISAEVDDDNVGGGVGGEVPGLGLVAYHGGLPPVTILSLQPLVHLTAGVTPAVLVANADTGIGLKTCKF